MRVLLLVLLLAWPAVSAPLSDADGPPEARKAVETLVAKGLLEGYPNGTFKGDRAITRYEVSQLLERLNASADAQMKDLAPRGDLHSLRETTKSLQQELDQLEGRTTQVESQQKNLDQRSGDN